ncbi:adenylate kinase [Euzebya tangerina]|uniref:adenylate kinase n=1 Tax=Euzebya tangerina TaxID=591198 RepID=UPI0013C341F2|nr:adenylate kinase [Euzebya tangerina]
MRIAVSGVSGAGKTTLARALAERLDVPHLELDSLAHQPDWERLPTPEFRDRVRDFCSQEGWTVCGTYPAVRDVVLLRAEVAVLLHPPRHRVMRRLVPRTARRMIMQEPLWNGNRERPRSLLHTTPEENILLWAWTTHGRRPAQFTAEEQDPRWAHITFLRYDTDVTAARVISDAGA